MDEAKLVASCADVPVINIPTSTATCAAVTPLSVMYERESGATIGTIKLMREVDAVLVDLDVLVCQPARLLCAGVMDAMAKNFWPMIGTANQVAYTAIEDAVDAMKEAGMWRQQEKVKAQKAIDEFHKYEHQAWVHFTELGDDRYPLWQDLVGRAAQKLEPDILKLYFAIKNQIDKARVPNADVLAKIQVGVAMTTLATLMYDTLEAQFQSQTVINLRQAFCGGRITVTE